MANGKAAVARRFLAGALVMAQTACLSGPLGPEPVRGDVDVLFIGNSLTYTHDLPGMLEALVAEGADSDLRIEAVTGANFGLFDHWLDGTATEAIAATRPRVVVLQQGPSATEGRPSLLDYSERFAERVRAAGGVPALYMVWPSRARSFDFDGVFDSYRTAAENVDGYFYPSGEAWRVAWESDPELDLYGGDGFHPAVLGSYLAALVMYEQLTGLDARDLPPWIPAGSARLQLAPDVAALVQAAAHEANARHARTPGD